MGFGEEEDIFVPRDTRLALPLEVELEIAGVLWTYVIAGENIVKLRADRVFLEKCKFFNLNMFVIRIGKTFYVY